MELIDRTIYSFPPIVDSSSRILILGTMPGKESLRQYAYYAHPQNSFWRIIFELLGLQLSSDPEIRREVLLTNRIALWDVLKLCARSTSLDSDIESEEPNDLSLFLSQYPNITKIYFNGKEAARYFHKYFKHINIPIQVMPSTSPAYAINWKLKLKDWKSILTKF